MKNSGKCPKCQSDRIATIPSKPGTFNQIKIGLFGFANVTRYVCTACGYLEQHVADAKSLRELSAKSRSGPSS